ncbi:PBP1A family penicillin-binding protein [Thioclava litoralis]|uniref:peptidoglycan glycosyltransferase n=1 Tax=Thioclava litoralis TaxID=3076557 RepID=A0ABZ1E0S5_9RHOB|nr:PBP1A family penicillin-binding protein [Thioclava sp. FTW29]
MANNGGPRKPLVAERRYPRGGKPGPKKTPPKKSAKPARKRPVRRHGLIVGLLLGLLRFFGSLLFKVTWRVFAVIALVLGSFVYYYYTQLPPLETLLDGRTRGSVTMLDRDNQVFAWRGETFGGQITAKNVSPYLREAVVATEDRRFYHHFGVSPRGIASAIRINLSEGRGPFSGNGGSTITQQVAKLLCLGVEYDPKKWKNEAEYETDCRSGGLTRKIKEIPYALAMEAKYTKNDILTIYLNRAYLGAGARGFEAAAQRYFGISAANVNPQQAAMLAGLLKAPTRYAPTNNLARSQARAGTVLALMHEQKFLTDAQYQEAVAHPATLSEAAQKRAGGYFADWVMDDIPPFLSSDTTEDVIVHTTLDQRVQAAAESALKDVFDNKVKDGSKAEAAIIVMSADGAVRAMVGGRESKVTGAFNRATMALRQPGSTFKPFVYAAAMDMGYTPDSIVQDTPLTLNIPGSGPWSPQNYERTYSGPITLTQALTHSVNVATVRLQEEVGRDAVRKVAEDFGFGHNLAKGPALGLGVSESTLIDMTGAYAGILNGGSSVRPYGLTDLRLKGDQTPIFTSGGGIGERVISEKAARELVYMMHSVVENGTGRRAKLNGYEVAGKTGTTQSARDAWFIGFTADYVTGVWMGNDNNKPLTGVTGGGLPAEIWHEVMTRVEQGQESKPLPMADPSEWRGQTQPYDGQTYDGQTYSSDGTVVSGWNAQNQPVQQQEPNIAEKIINDVLGAITGKR